MFAFIFGAFLVTYVYRRGLRPRVAEAPAPIFTEKYSGTFADIAAVVCLQRRRIVVRKTMLYAIALSFGFALPTTANMPVQVSCIADEVLFIWYREALTSGLPAIPSPTDPNQRIVAARAMQPETRMRFAEGKLFISDSQRSEYFYGDLIDEGGGRYRSSHFTLMFDEKYQTLITISADQLSSTVTSFKCLAG